MKIRTLCSHEREALLSLLDGWDLADGWRGEDLFRRYLELDPSYSDENVWVAEEDGRLVGCVQIFPRRLRVLDRAVSTGGIGSVFTREDCRGRGIATNLLSRSCEAMEERGMELAILFSDRLGFYEKRGWQPWKTERSVLRRRGERLLAPAEGLELALFREGSDLSDVKKIHAEYSSSRTGTVVRDDALWKASLRLAGNPQEEFWVARRGGRRLAYVRATLLAEVFSVTEMGRTEDGAEALARLVASLLEPRDHDPLAPPGKSSKELRSFVVLPAFDDVPLTVALEHGGVSNHPMDDPTCLLRCLDAAALAARLELELLPDESGAELLRRILPPCSLVFWPADRF